MAKVMSAIKKRSTVEGVDVQEAVQEYLASAHVKQLSPRTQEEYTYELGVFAQWCARHALVQNKKREWHAGKTEDEPILLHMINDQAVRCFIEHIAATVTPKKVGQPVSSYTLNGYVRVIKSFLNWCVLDLEYGKQLEGVVVQRIKEPELIETIIETFTPEHLDALFAACQCEESEHLQLRDEAILGVLLDAGLRASELVTLTIGHVSTDPRDAHVRVLGKGDKWGEVGLGDRSRKCLAKYIRMFREPTIEYGLQEANPRLSNMQVKQLLKQELPRSLAFVNRYGQPMKPSGLYQMVERLGEWAGIVPEDVRCSPHTFRHTFAVMFIRNDGDIYTLSKLLRHSSVKVTEQYLKSLKQSEARHGQRSVLDNL